MSITHWSPNLGVGIEELDADHRELIELLNRLDTEVSEAAGQEEIAEILGELVARTERHFRREEAIMAREHYPESDHHTRLHRALMAELQQFRQELSAGMEIGPEITEFIKRWLVSHIIESDKHLGGYLLGRQSR